MGRGEERRGIAVLLYHAIDDVAPHAQEGITVSPSVFASHLQVIADLGAHVVPLGDMARKLRDGAEVPPNTVAVTFDDGYLSVLRHALPALQCHAMPATLFQISGCLGGRFSGASMLSGPQLRELRDGGFEIGSHTHSHPHLDLIDHARLRGELSTSRDALEQVLEARVDGVAYPHGSHRRRVVRAASAVGYAWGAAVKNAFSHADDDPWAVARITVTAADGPQRIAELLRGDGAPMSWRRERLRTALYREVRRVRSYEGHDRMLR